MFVVVVLMMMMLMMLAVVAVILLLRWNSFVFQNSVVIAQPLAQFVSCGAVDIVTRHSDVETCKFSLLRARNNRISRIALVPA